MNQTQLDQLRANYEMSLACERAGEALYVVARLTEMLLTCGMNDRPLDDDRVRMYVATDLIEMRDERMEQWLYALHEVRLQRAHLWTMTSQRDRALAPGKLEAARAAAQAEWRYEMAELYLINYEGELECETPIPTRQFVWEVEAGLPVAYLP